MVKSGSYRVSIRFTYVRAGKLSFNKSRQDIMNKDWSSLCFKVFDAPTISKPYLLRQQFLKDVIKESKHISLAPVQKCEGLHHLLFSLEGLQCYFVIY